MKFLGIIPARFASTRFPGKPLIDIGGKSMIRRVYDQAGKSQLLNRVIVATDDQRIYDHVENFGGSVKMTSPAHQSGTDRIEEVASFYPEFDIIINIQGDEPFIDPKQVDLLCGCFDKPGTKIATLIKVIESYSELENPNIPKVIINYLQEAIYFSRNPLPFFRNAEKDLWLKNHTYYKHIGIYGYRKETLFELTKLPESILEKAEALEQLRWLENGYTIQTAVTEIESLSIDTPEDLCQAMLKVDFSRF